MTGPKFSFELDFKMDELKNMPILVAGTSYRWLGIEVNSSGNPGILYNNQTELMIQITWFQINGIEPKLNMILV